MKEEYKRAGWLLLGISGVVLYRHLPDWWCLLALIPIVVGFSEYYGGKKNKMKIQGKELMKLILKFEKQSKDLMRFKFKQLLDEWAEQFVFDSDRTDIKELKKDIDKIK